MGGKKIPSWLSALFGYYDVVIPSFYVSTLFENFCNSLKTSKIDHAGIVLLALANDVMSIKNVKRQILKIMTF